MIHAVVFDLGGVLVRLDGMTKFMSLVAPQMPLEAFHRQWLHSGAVRAHESGKIDVEAFADAYQLEMGTHLPRRTILDAFDAFITGPFEGAEDLLQQLKKRVPVAILSNISAAHWTGFVWRHNAMIQNIRLFLSYEMGLLKPDTACFQHVINSLNYAPESILFFDDNPVNVDAAKKTGLSAYRVNGVDEAALLIRSIGV